MGCFATTRIPICSPEASARKTTANMAAAENLEGCNGIWGGAVPNLDKFGGAMINLYLAYHTVIPIQHVYYMLIYSEI